jgi:hypothetical protein
LGGASGDSPTIPVGTPVPAPPIPSIGLGNDAENIAEAYDGITETRPSLPPSNSKAEPEIVRRPKSIIEALQLSREQREAEATRKNETRKSSGNSDTRKLREIIDEDDPFVEAAPLSQSIMTHSNSTSTGSRTSLESFANDFDGDAAERKRARNKAKKNAKRRSKVDKGKAGVE